MAEGGEEEANTGVSEDFLGRCKSGEKWDYGSKADNFSHTPSQH
jgi:hypothetical protein